MLSLIKVLFFFIAGVFLVSFMNSGAFRLDLASSGGTTPDGVSDRSTYSRSYDTNNDGVISDAEYRQGEINRIAQEVAELEKDVADAVKTQNQSRYYGSVSLGSDGAGADTRNEEYVTLYADTSNTETINITGWKLKSLLSKRGATIGKGIALLDDSHTPWKNQKDIFLAPGDSAIVNTGGAAGISTSFLVNKCMGYLPRTRFTPEIWHQSCPLLKNEDLASFDLTYNDFRDEDDYDACIEAIEDIRSCEIVPSPNRDLTDDCRDFIKTYSNYDGCVDLHQDDPDFYGDEWRIFLNSSSRDLWRVEREAIGLFDKDGKIVDVVKY